MESMCHHQLERGKRRKRLEQEGRSEIEGRTKGKREKVGAR